MNKVFNFIKKRKLLSLGILIYVSFFISAAWTKWYDIFFFGTSLHICCQGLDFYQVPKGLYSFLHGGSLNGIAPTGITGYAKDFLVNYNVYHPYFTILVGSFFILFNPTVSFFLWFWLKLLITLGLVFYVYEKFKHNKYLDFALFIMLINSNQYIDIRIGQYQFLLNIFLLLLLISFARNEDNIKTAFYFFITLLVKPIGILWAPLLFFRKKYKTLLLGLGVFLLITGLFLVNNIGDYYVNNLIFHIKTPSTTRAIDFMSLETLLRFTFSLNPIFISFLKIFILVFIFILSFFKKIDFLKIMFLLVIYFLFFYDLLFQYHFSILMPIFTVGLLSSPSFQKKMSRLLIFLLSIPGPFFLLRIINSGFIDHSGKDINPTFLGWQVVSFWQLSLLLILTFIIFSSELKYLVEFIFKPFKIVSK